MCGGNILENILQTADLTLSTPQVSRSSRLEASVRPSITPTAPQYRPCAYCRQMLSLDTTTCPYCGAPQAERSPA